MPEEDKESSVNDKENLIDKLDRPNKPEYFNDIRCAGSLKKILYFIGEYDPHEEAVCSICGRIVPTLEESRELACEHFLRNGNVSYCSPC